MRPEKDKKVQRPRGMFSSLPSGIDKVLKVYFDGFREKGELPPELGKEAGLEGALLFEDTELMDVWRNNFKGIKWTDAAGNLFKGAVDELLVRDNKLIVLDYKTRGWPPKSDTGDRYQSQLDMYNFLLRQNGYDTEDVAYLMFFWPKEIDAQGRFVFNTALDERQVDIANAERLVTESVKVLDGPMPDFTEGCEYCQHFLKLSQKG
jgi:hypothetical protein